MVGLEILMVQVYTIIFWREKTRFARRSYSWPVNIMYAKQAQAALESKRNQRTDAKRNNEMQP